MKYVEITHIMKIKDNSILNDGSKKLSLSLHIFQFQIIENTKEKKKNYGNS